MTPMPNESDRVADAAGSSEVSHASAQESKRPKFLCLLRQDYEDGKTAIGFWFNEPPGESERYGFIYHAGMSLPDMAKAFEDLAAQMRAHGSTGPIKLVNKGKFPGLKMVPLPE